MIRAPKRTLPRYCIQFSWARRPRQSSPLLAGRANRPEPAELRRRAHLSSPPSAVAEKSRAAPYTRRSPCFAIMGKLTTGRTAHLMVRPAPLVRRDYRRRVRPQGCSRSSATRAAASTAATPSATTQKGTWASWSKVGLPGPALRKGHTGEVILRPGAGQAIAMVLHELATTALFQLVTIPLRFLPMMATWSGNRHCKQLLQGALRSNCCPGICRQLDCATNSIGFKREVNSAAYLVG